MDAINHANENKHNPKGVSLRKNTAQLEAIYSAIQYYLLAQLAPCMATFQLSEFNYENVRP